MPADSLLAGVGAIAVVGASEDSFLARMGIQTLTDYNFKGRIMPVHHRGGHLGDLRIARSIGELPAAPDLAIIAVGIGRVADAIEELAGSGCRTAIVVSGTASTDEGAGAQSIERIQAACRAHQIDLVGPNCMGIADLWQDVVAICEPVPAGIRPGNVSLLSHSGALVSGILDVMKTADLGVSRVVSAGNGAVVSYLDWLHWLVDDEHTDVVACYAEGFESIERLMQIAERARGRGKQIVALKVGRTTLGSSIAQSHTATIAGEFAQLQAVAADTGIILVDDVQSLVDTCAVWQATRDSSRHGGVLVITASGGAAALAADLSAETHLRLAELDERSTARMTEFVGDQGFVGNPMDIGASGADPTKLPDFYRAVLNDSNVAVAVHIYGAMYPDHEPDRERHRRQFLALAGAASATHTPLVFATLGDQARSEWLGELVRGDELFTTTRGVSGAFTALAALQLRQRCLRQDDLLASPRDTENVQARGGRTTWLSEHDAKMRLRRAALPVVGGTFVQRPESLVDAQLPGNAPYVVKAVVDDVTHKSALGLVTLGLVDAQAIRAECASMRASIERQGIADRHRGYLVEPMVFGREFMVAFRRCASMRFVTVALGGTLVEQVSMTATSCLPLHARSWHSLTTRSGLDRVLAASTPSAADALRRFVEDFAHQVDSAAFEDVHTVELNPVVVGADGSVTIVDAVMG
jgi:acetate---CoA ligase (ADP-forming)